MRTIRYVKSHFYNLCDLTFENDYNLKNSYAHSDYKSPDRRFISVTSLFVTFPQGASAIMQQSRPGEQRRLFTITNVTRVNSAIRSYCSCRRRGTIRYSSDRLHRAAIRRCSVTARSDCTRSISPSKTDSISIHLFSLPFH